MTTTEKTKIVLTPDSPQWETFVKRLDATLAETGCAGGTNKDNAEAVMRDMGGVDIEASRRLLRLRNPVER